LLQEDIHDIEIVLPPPEAAVINVNFTLDHGRVTVILTEDRSRILARADRAVINGITYKAAKCDLRKATEAFLRKYGREHVDRYFTGRRRVAYILTPLKEDSTASMENNNHVEANSAQYSARIQQDPVQSHLRTVTSDYLRRFITNEISILEIGCSNGYEVSRAKNGFSEVSCVCADVSADAIHFAKGNSPVGTYEKLVEVKGKWNEHIGSFDIIYSTFGATDTYDFHKISSFARNNLNSNGLFIATVLNRFAVWDLMLSVITRKKGYAKSRLSGVVPVGNSRYPVPVLTRNVKEVRSDKILHLKAFRGVSILFAPYNYRRINQLLIKVPFIRKLDEILSGVFPFCMLCEYLLLVMSPATS